MLIRQVALQYSQVPYFLTNDNYSEWKCTSLVHHLKQRTSLNPTLQTTSRMVRCYKKDGLLMIQQSMKVENDNESRFYRIGMKTVNSNSSANKWN